MYFKEHPPSFSESIPLTGLTLHRKQLPQKKAKSTSLALVVGLTGLEPVTPRLSSACSNQLSYKPDHLSQPVLVSQSCLPDTFYCTWWS